MASYTQKGSRPAFSLHLLDNPGTSWQDKTYYAIKDYLSQAWSKWEEQATYKFIDFQ